MHLIFSGNLPDRFDAHQRFQSNLGFEGTRVPLALSSFAHGSAVLSSPAEPEKSNLGYCPKFGVHFYPSISVSVLNPEMCVDLRVILRVCRWGFRAFGLCCR